MISTKSKECYPYLLITLLVIVASTTACYTLLQHPRVSQIDYNRPTHNKCAECHTNDEIWEFHHLPHSPVTDVPWWYERYWGYDNASDLETIPLHDQSSDIPVENNTPYTGQTKASTGKQKTSAAATTKDKKEKGDGKTDGKPKKSKRSIRPKGEKKKKNKKKKP